jgi:hypothetical protein
MTEMKRGPGRPPKVRPEAKTADDEMAEKLEKALQGQAAELPVTHVVFTPAPTIPAAAKPVSERKVEIELIRKYVPDGQPQEIKQSVPAGTVISLPQWEATRALKLGIARATDRTFD